MDSPFRGKNLQQKLDILQGAGFGRDEALDVMRYHIKEQHQETGRDTLSAAYQAGPGFDPEFYHKMSGEGSWLTHWHEFYLSEIRDAFLEEPEAAEGGGYRDLRLAGYVAAFLTLLAAVTGCGGGGGQGGDSGQDGPGIIVPDGPSIVVPEPVMTPGEFRVHEFEYEHEGRKHRVSLMTEGPEVKDMDGALQAVRRDDCMALMTVGCEKELAGRIYRLARRMYGLNPGLMRELEPVVVRLDSESTVSLAGPNCTDDINSVLARIGQRRDDKGDYGDYCDWFVQDVDMPESGPDFESMMEAVKKRYMTVHKGDFLDVVSCGIGTEESMVHEFGHLVTMENAEVYYMMLQWLKGTVPLPRLERGLLSDDYAGMRWRQVEAWAEGKVKEAERKMKEELERPGAHPRFRAAIRSFGSPEEALRRYMQLIEEGTLYFKYTEDLAEGTVDFMFQTITYLQDRKAYMEAEASGECPKLFLEFHRELEAKLAAAREAGDQAEAKRLEEDLRKDQEFLDKVRDDSARRLLRLRRSMASLAVEDLFRGEIAPSGGRK